MTACEGGGRERGGKGGGGGGGGGGGRMKMNVRELNQMGAVHVVVCDEELVR